MENAIAKIGWIAGDRLVRLPEVKQRTGLSRSTIYARIEAGRFPRQGPMDRGMVRVRRRRLARRAALNDRTTQASHRRR